MRWLCMGASRKLTLNAAVRTQRDAIRSVLADLKTPGEVMPVAFIERLLHHCHLVNITLIQSRVPMPVFDFRDGLTGRRGVLNVQQLCDSLPALRRKERSPRRLRMMQRDCASMCCMFLRARRLRLA